MIMLRTLVFLAVFGMVLTATSDMQGTLLSPLKSSLMQGHLHLTLAGHEFYLTFYPPYVIAADKQGINDLADTSMTNQNQNLYSNFLRGLLRYLNNSGRRAVTLSLRDIEFAESRRFYDNRRQQKDSSLPDVQKASVAAGVLSSICSYCQESGNQQCINIYCFQSNNQGATA